MQQKFIKQLELSEKQIKRKGSKIDLLIDVKEQIKNGSDKTAEEMWKLINQLTNDFKEVENENIEREFYETFAQSSGEQTEFNQDSRSDLDGSYREESNEISGNKLKRFLLKHKIPKKYIVSKKNKCGKRYDIFIILLAIINSVSIPLELAFKSESLAWKIFDLGIDLIFLVDVILFAKVSRLFKFRHVDLFMLRQNFM